VAEVAEVRALLHARHLSNHSANCASCSAGRPTFSIEISEISEAFRNSRKSRNNFPDFNCYFAFNASCLVISSFLINLLVKFAFSLDLIFLSIYGCDIGFEMVFTPVQMGLIFFSHL
jgi:hypothetical protein